MEIFITRTNTDNEWVYDWHFDDTKTVAILYEENGLFKVNYDSGLPNVEESKIEYIVIRTKNNGVNKAFEICFWFWNKFKDNISRIYLHCDNDRIEKIFKEVRSQDAKLFGDLEDKAVKAAFAFFVNKFEKYSIAGGVGTGSKSEQINEIITRYKLNKTDNMLIIKHKIFEPLYVLAIRISSLKSGKMPKEDQQELMGIFKDTINSERNELIANNLNELTDLIEYLPVDKTDCSEEMKSQMESLLSNMDIFHEKLNKFDDMFDQCFSLVN